MGSSRSILYASPSEWTGPLVMHCACGLWWAMRRTCRLNDHVEVVPRYLSFPVSSEMKAGCSGTSGLDTPVCSELNVSSGNEGSSTASMLPADDDPGPGAELCCREGYAALAAVPWW